MALRNAHVSTSSSSGSGPVSVAGCGSVASRRSAALLEAYLAMLHSLLHVLQKPHRHQVARRLADVARSCLHGAGSWTTVAAWNGWRCCAYGVVV